MKDRYEDRVSQFVKSRANGYLLRYHNVNMIYRPRCIQKRFRTGLLEKNRGPSFTLSVNHRAGEDFIMMKYFYEML